MEKQSFEFKASNVEAAKKKGLESLGLTEDQVEIEVLATGGIFSKAQIRITPKDVEEEPIEEEATEEPVSEAEETGEEEVKEVKKPEEKVSFETLKLKSEEGKNFLRNLLDAAGGKSATFESRIRDDELCYFIGGENARKYIGYKGETLEAIQVLVSHYLNQNNDGPHISVFVDADFYREKRKKTLHAMARRLATQAFRTHKEISLEPMNSYERRIIHTALQNSLEAETRSEGEGSARHVIIVPKNGQMSYGNDSSFRRKGPSRTKSYGYEKRKFF